MNFYAEFLHALFLDPFRAVAALHWHFMRKRVRARNLLRRISSKSPHIYDHWARYVENLVEIEMQSATEIACWRKKPRFTVILYVDASMDAHSLRAGIDCVERQFYRDWELLLVHHPDSGLAIPRSNDRIRSLKASAASDVAALNAGIEAARGTFIVPLSPGNRLSPAALYWLAEALQSSGGAAILYGDHDQIDRRGRRSKPWFKPLWNREMFLSQDFISAAFAISTELARAVGPVREGVEGAASFALLLDATANLDSGIVHVPRILCHLPDVMGPDNKAARLEAVSRHIHQAGATASAGDYGLLRITWPLPEELPLVSIIIPTRDKVDVLRTCVDSLLEKTIYPNYEIIIVDNGSSEPATKQYFSDILRSPHIRIIEYDAAFNFSDMNNLAARHARGDFLCLLNNDTEIISPDWLNEMMRYAVQECVGAVGARLLYPDGSIQHAGVVIGLGNAAGHAHRRLPAGEPGYFCRAYVAHYASAVTAACLVVEKRKFARVGGLDAEKLKVAFNDVDLCLKLEKAGWRNVYVPQAVLFHHESKSRESDFLPRNIDRYRSELDVLQKRWNTIGYADPLHHPNLDRASESYVIRL